MIDEGEGDNVVRLKTSDTFYGKIDPNLVLQKAIDEGMQEVIVLGWAKEGDGSFYLGLSNGYKPDALWLLELARREVLGLG